MQAFTVELNRGRHKTSGLDSDPQMDFLDLGFAGDEEGDSFPEVSVFAESSEKAGSSCLRLLPREGDLSACRI